MKTTLEQLKEHPSLGSFAGIARACGVTREAVRKWRRIPAEHCAAIESKTGGEWTRAMLRPDLFADPAPEAEQAEAA